MTNYHRIGTFMLVLLWSTGCAPVKKVAPDSSPEKQPLIQVNKLPPPPAKPEAAAKSQRKELLQKRIEAALAHVAKRDIHTTHSSWTVFHGILGVGDHLELVDPKTNKRVRALDVICDSPEKINGLQFLDEHPWGLDVQLGPPGIGQGHQDQYVAELAQQGMPLDRQVLLPRYEKDKLIGRDKHTFKDLVRYVKNRASTKQGQELSWTIMVLSHYEGTNFEWTNRYKEKWHFTDLIRAELDASVEQAACGGTHRLFGLTWALHVHVKKGGKVEGIWKEVADKIKKHEQLAKTNQNPDGTFSTEYICKPNDPNNPADNVRRINTTGHVLEWLALSLTKKELREPWVEDAANGLSLLILGCQGVDLESGSLYHAAHGLQMYYARIWGNPAGSAEKVELPPPPDETEK